MSTDLALPTQDGTTAPPADALINLEAEASLLGAMLFDNGCIEDVADIITAADFAEPLHARIFTTLLAEFNAGRPANPVTIKGYFHDDPAMAQLGGTTYLARLSADMTAMVSGPTHMARHLRDLTRRRDLQEKLSEALKACGDFNASLSSIADIASAALVDGPADGLIEFTGGGCVEQHIQDLANGTAGITCGRIPSFDHIAGALGEKHFVIVAARPGMGKTALAVSYSIGAAKQGYGVLFVSLEMSGPELGGRLAADMCYGATGEGRVPYSHIRDGELNDWQRSRVGQAAVELDKLPLTVIDAPGITPGRLSRLVRRHARRMEARGTPLKLVVVDYLQRMRTDRVMRSKYEEISEISASLKDIAKANGITVMALTQLSREVEKRSDKRPILADLRDSGQIEQDADTVIFLLREEYYYRQTEPDADAPEWPGWNDALERMKGKIEFIVAKRRGGETGGAKGEFLGAFQAVRG